MSTCPPVYLSSCLPVSMSTCPTVYRSSCLPVSLSSCLPVYLSTFLPFYLSTWFFCLPVFMSTCPSVYLSSCLPVFQSTCFPFFLSSCLPVYMSICITTFRKHVYLFLYPFFIIIFKYKFPLPPLSLPWLPSLPSTISNLQILLYYNPRLVV